MPAAPFVIAAYVLVWVALLVYVCFITIGLRKTEGQMRVLEDLLKERQADKPLD
jgi:hypothetical protein